MNADRSASRRHTNLTRFLKPLPVGTVDDINLRQRKVVLLGISSGV